MFEFAFFPRKKNLGVNNVACFVGMSPAPLRGGDTLDHGYANVTEHYSVIPLSHLEQSDSIYSCFYSPKYSTIIKSVRPLS